MQSCFARTKRPDKSSVSRRRSKKSKKHGLGKAGFSVGPPPSDSGALVRLDSDVRAISFMYGSAFSAFSAGNSAVHFLRRALLVPCARHSVCLIAVDIVPGLPLGGSGCSGCEHHANIADAPSQGVSTDELGKRFEVNLDDIADIALEV